MIDRITLIVPDLDRAEDDYVPDLRVPRRTTRRHRPCADPRDPPQGEHPGRAGAGPGGGVDQAHPGQRCLVAGAQPEHGQHQQPGPGRDRGDDGRDHRADRRTGAYADRERGWRPGRERHPGQAEDLRGERAVLAELDHRVVTPGEHRADRPGTGGHRHRQQHQPGQQPPGPPSAQGPGQPERAGLQLTGHHRDPGQDADQDRTGVPAGGAQDWPVLAGAPAARAR